MGKRVKGWFSRVVKFVATVGVKVASGFVKRKYPEIPVSAEVLEETTLAVLGVLDSIAEAIGYDLFADDMVHRKVTLSPDEVVKIAESHYRLKNAAKALPLSTQPLDK